MQTNYEAELAERVAMDVHGYIEQFPVYKVANCSNGIKLYIQASCFNKTFNCFLNVLRSAYC